MSQQINWKIHKCAVLKSTLLGSVTFMIFGKMRGKLLFGIPIQQQTRLFVQPRELGIENEFLSSKQKNLVRMKIEE